MDLIRLSALRRCLVKARHLRPDSELTREIQSLIGTTTRNRKILLKEYDAWLKSQLQSYPHVAIVKCGNPATKEQ